MTFANPEWLWVLCVLPLLAALRVRSHVLARRGAPGLVSPRLRGSLIVGNNLWLRWATFSFQLLALGLLVTALARPRWGFEEGETATEGRNLLIAIDTSRSMLANDLQPNRLTRAKLAAMDIMQALPEDRIGLVAFAGRAFLSAPLTIDHDAVAESIEQMDTEIIPRGGTNLVAPVQLALETFEKAGTKEAALIIFSDGEDLEGGGELEAVREQAAEAGMVIVAVGVGTEQGTVIPDAKATDGFVKDEAGNVVRSRLNSTALQAVSAGTGIYLNLGSNSAMTSVVTSALSQVAKTLAESGSGQRPIERFMWPLGFAVICFLVAFLLPDSLRFIRRLRAEEAPVRGKIAATGSVTKGVLIFAACGFAPHAEANMSAETPAYVSLTNEKFDRALEQYEVALKATQSTQERAWLNLGLGSAAYRTGDYDRAKLAWGETLREGDRKLTVQAHYNLGNALFREGMGILETAGFVFPGEETPEPEVDPGGGLSQLLTEQLKSLGLDQISSESLEELLRAVSIAPQTGPEERDQINNLLLALKGGVIDVESVANGLMKGLGLSPAPAPPADPNANIDIAPTVEQWLSAIEHYEAALKIEPENGEAQRNIEVVRSYLEAVQPPEPPKEEEEQPQDEEEKEDEEEEDQEDEPKEEDQEDEKDPKDEKDDEKDDEENQNPPNGDENQPEDQPENPEGDGENEEDQPEGDQPENPETPEGGEPSPPDDPQDPGEGEESPESGTPDQPPPGEDGSEGESEPQDSEPQDSTEGQPDESEGGQPPGQQPQPPATPGEPEETAPEGELEANGGSAPPLQPSPAGQPAQVDPAEMQTNPETGFSPSQARNYLQNLSDEDFEVRPLVPIGSSKAEKFKNW